MLAPATHWRAGSPVRRLRLAHGAQAPGQGVTPSHMSKNRAVHPMWGSPCWEKGRTYLSSFFVTSPLFICPSRYVKMCATCYRLIKIISSGTSPSYHFRKNITYNKDKSHVKFLGPQNMSISSPSWRRCVKYNSRHPLTGKNSPLF